MQAPHIESGMPTGGSDHSTLPTQPFRRRHAWLRMPAIAIVLITLLCIMALGGMSFLIMLSEAIEHPMGSKAVFNTWLGMLCSVVFVLLPAAGIIIRKPVGWLLTTACVYLLMSFSIADWSLEPMHFYARPNGAIWSFVPLAMMHTAYLKRCYTASPGVRQQVGAAVLGAFWGVLMALAMSWEVLG